MQIGVGGRLERIGLMEAELAHFQIDCALVTDFTQRDEEVLPRKVRVLKGGDMQIVFGVVAVQVKRAQTLAKGARHIGGIMAGEYGVAKVQRDIQPGHGVHQVQKILRIACG